MRPTALALSFGLCLLARFGASQSAPGTFTLSGTVRDARDGQTLLGATVYAAELRRGTSTDVDGDYALRVPAGADSLTVTFSYVGLATRRERLLLSADARLDLALGAGEGVALDAVVVEADGLRGRARSTQTSLEQVSARQARLIPALLGESDILKVIQLKPGIPSGAEGATGIYVRGGGTDQNLVLLDGAVVYNPNHLFGFFSTFNTDAVQSLTLYKGGFPAQYGGRLSSVIDVSLREGDRTRFRGSGGLGLLASRLTLEGPLGARDNSGDAAAGGFVVSARRTYVDLATDAINRVKADDPEFNRIPAYNFYDLNAKVDYTLSPRDRLSLGGYFGRDRFRFGSDNFAFGFDWGNATAAARWNHSFSPRLYANTAATFSDYRYVVRNEITGFNFELGSQVQDLTLRTDLFAQPSPRHALRFGAVATYHAFGVGRLQAGSDNGQVSFSAGNRYDGVELGVYVGDELTLNERISAEAGLRISGFVNGGTTYVRPEPRLALNYAGDIATAHPWSLKASYARMHQYVHLVSTAGVALPTDVWYPSTRAVRPQASDQVAFGGTYLLAEGLLFTGETYYKWLRNQVDFVDGANLFVNDDLEGDFDFGRGYAYGFEAQVERTAGRLTGWVGYTWQRTRRGDFARIMDGRYFSPRFDRRHDVSVVAMLELNRRLTATATWVYGSGDLYWLPLGRTVAAQAPGADFQSVVPVYGDRNNYRLVPYHRGDVGLVVKLFPAWGESDLTFSVFNVYDRRNAFFVYLEPEFEDVDRGGTAIEVPTGLSPKQVSLFPVLPSVTWNFSF